MDSSDYSNRATLEAVELAGRFDSRITATHVYAAKLHDLRFRQMEGGLPEQFREEQELERQRRIDEFARRERLEEIQTMPKWFRPTSKK